MPSCRSGAAARVLRSITSGLRRAHPSRRPARTTQTPGWSLSAGRHPARRQGHVAAVSSPQRSQLAAGEAARHSTRRYLPPRSIAQASLRPVRGLASALKRHCLPPAHAQRSTVARPCQPTEAAAPQHLPAEWTWNRSTEQLTHPMLHGLIKQGASAAGFPFAQLSDIDSWSLDTAKHLCVKCALRALRPARLWHRVHSLLVLLQLPGKNVSSMLRPVLAARWHTAVIGTSSTSLCASLFASGKS